MTSLRLSTASRDELVRWASDAAPDEACGLFFGARARGLVDVRGVRRIANVAPSGSHRFELDPAAIPRAEDEARCRGAELLGVWHSHPGGRALPSAADRRSAVPGWVQLVVAVAPDAGPELRAFLLTRRSALELAVTVRDARRRAGARSSPG